MTRLTVRTAALDDAAEAGRLRAWVAEAGGSPFHLPEWSRAVARGCGQRSHYLVAEAADGAIAGVLPMTEIRSPIFGKALVSVGFAVDGGALGSPGATRMLTDAALTLAEARGCPTVELRGGALPEAPGWTVDETTYLGFNRVLEADDAAQLAAIPRKQRAEIRRSQAQDVVVETGVARHQILEHHAVYAESVRNLGTPVFPRALFENVIAAFGDGADILIVRHRGAAVASVLSLYWQGTVFPYWGGGTAAARGLRANDAMYFALMRHARERGCTRFDFGRSKAGTGAAAFKKNWGFTPTPLRYAKRTTDGRPPRSVNPNDPRYSLQVRAWKHMPLWLANRLGPLIARGLG